MEQKRTLWILLAVGIFFMVVLGSAVIVYSSSAKKDTTALQQRSNGAVWVSPDTVKATKNDMIAQDLDTSVVASVSDENRSDTKDTVPENEASVVSDLASPIEADDIEDMKAAHSKSNLVLQSEKGIAQTDNLTVIATGNTTVYGLEGTTTIDLTSTKDVSSGNSNVKAQNNAAEKAIEETRMNKIAEKKIVDDVDEPLVEKTYSEKKQKKEYKAPVDENEKYRAKKAEAKKDSGKKAEKKAAAKSAAKSSGTERFWVQAASYASKKNADDARVVLEKNKIQCEVFTFTDKRGKLFYRVRVGPYTTKNEATYWKNRIDAIPLFAKSNSFVTAK